MAKTVVVLVLALTQLLSWSTRAVYLCVDSDGSICLDGGPDSCGCHGHECHEAHDGLHEGHSDHYCNEHHHGLPTRSSDAPQGWTLAESSCECSHIQIVSQQQPTTVHAMVSHDVTDQAFVAVLPDDLPAIHAATGQLESSGGAFRAASSFALIERASVCLRC